MDRTWRLLAAGLTAVSCLYVSTVQLSGVDFWLQAKIGEIIVRDGAIPTTLLFPFTEAATLKFNAHEWLTSILFHVVLSTLGEAGMPFFTGLLGLAYFFLAARLAHLRSNFNTAAALLLGMVALATENYRHVLRPELISLLLMGYFWTLLERFRIHPNWKTGAMSAIIVLIWANGHGSFILAPVMTAIYAIGLALDDSLHARSGHERATHKILTFAALSIGHVLVCLLNPFGFELFGFVVGFSNTPELSTVIAEWSPTLDQKWFDLRGFWLAWVVWSGTLFVLLKNFRRLSAVDVLFFLFFSALAVKAIRFPVYLGLMSAAVCAPYIAPKWSKPELQTKLYQLATVIALIVGGVAMAYGNAQGVHPYSTGFAKLSDPMVRALENPIHSGNVLTSMELGAELIYRAYPRLKPSIDCRIDSYGLDYLDSQEKLLDADTSLTEFVQRYDVHYMLFEKWRLNQALQRKTWRDDRWVVVYMDKSVAFLRRADLPHP